MQTSTLVKSNYYMSDAAFDWLYPERIQQLSRRHWTPLSIAKAAARFLANQPGKKILDIGSGVGKFCLVGARFYPESSFYGIEQRKELYHDALAAKEATRLENVNFINGNFTQLDLSEYDGFYFYNSFFENLVDQDQIDHKVEYSTSLYNFYSRYLFKELQRKPSGTRLVTFHSLEDEVPPCYQMVDMSEDLVLKMWIRR
ncbi:methyltransferase family protein [Chitinophaga niastensis]|uniref:Methyltransferase family protein n=1 Tax=Chitinophaga niastensis TaxID=536980 RepID=A0A2P8HU47_CHINA|nr:methyltransferase domain-containing protein [Chitinophaga niastensis]PSL49751.1 methyltransferase family protein [Chitinophaga niastensis]